MPACHIGIRYDARGPNNTISLGDVSSMLALAEGAEVIRRGQADIMIVGGTGSKLNVTDFVWHGDARLGCNGKLSPARVSRPFDAKRCGMVYGEGAAQIVLESRAHAEARGAKVIARVAGTASRYELAAEGQQPAGDSIRRAINAALSAAKISAGDVGYVNAHGNSTREDDAAEAGAIQSVLGDTPVTAPKSYFGNLGPGSGMVELVVSLIGMERGAIPSTLNYEAPDPECPVKVATEVRPAEKPAFVKLTHNSTGQAVAVVVVRAEQ
jgi:3-oxoacyl-[acyl-carrier-protein] synthase II